ncbi:hypothetical protein G4B88_028215 [Cannabis sativa]|uniref:Replication factor A C-terminal domain-containing protein n=1 Tax=Cannabis sativa TaxID=3483 RepID=A0A7J6DQD9_CANSA|nr:hypothetical protein G4B88_028215 [Cannabis sativa]
MSQKHHLHETRIQAALFDDVIELYKNTLIMHKSYYISNAHVKRMDPRYNYLKNKYEWILNRSTLVEEVKEQEDQDVIPSPPAFSFIPFTSFQQYMDSSARVDIILTKPIVAAKNLKVVPHQSMCIDNHYTSQLLQSGKILASSSYIAKPPPNKEIEQISFIQNVEEKKSHYWIKGTISLDNFHQKFWYMACEKCNRSTGADFDAYFTCNYCWKDNEKGKKEIEIKQKAIARCCIQINIHDSTATLPATIFGEIAETFLECTAKKLMDETTEDGILSVENLINISTTKKYIIKIKTSKYEFRHKMEQKYIVEQLLDDIQSAL